MSAPEFEPTTFQLAFSCQGIPSLLSSVSILLNETQWQLNFGQIFKAAASKASKKICGETKIDVETFRDPQKSGEKFDIWIGHTSKICTSVNRAVGGSVGGGGKERGEGNRSSLGKNLAGVEKVKEVTLVLFTRSGRENFWRKFLTFFGTGRIFLNGPTIKKNF